MQLQTPLEGVFAHGQELCSCAAANPTRGRVNARTAGALVRGSKGVVDGRKGVLHHLVVSADTRGVA